jgi:hypothetical protein
MSETVYTLLILAICFAGWGMFMGVLIANLSLRRRVSSLELAAVTLDEDLDEVWNAVFPPSDDDGGNVVPFKRPAA